MYAAVLLPHAVLLCCMLCCCCCMLTIGRSNEGVEEMGRFGVGHMRMAAAEPSPKRELVRAMAMSVRRLGEGGGEGR